MKRGLVGFLITMGLIATTCLAVAIGGTTTIYSNHVRLRPGEFATFHTHAHGLTNSIHVHVRDRTVHEHVSAVVSLRNERARFRINHVHGRVHLRLGNRQIKVKITNSSHQAHRIHIGIRQ